MSAQRLRAKARADAVRVTIAAERRAIAALSETQARARAAGLVRNPGTAGVLRAGPLVTSIPWLGPVITTKVLRYAGVSFDARLRDLTARQRRELAAAIELPRSEQWTLFGSPLERDLIRARDDLARARDELATELLDLRGRIANATVLLNAAPAGASDLARAVRTVLA